MATSINIPIGLISVLDSQLGQALLILDIPAPISFALAIANLDAPLRPGQRPLIIIVPSPLQRRQADLQIMFPLHLLPMVGGTTITHQCLIAQGRVVRLGQLLG